VQIMVYAPAAGVVLDGTPIYNAQFHKVWEVPAPTTITVTPVNDVNPVNTVHTVIATVTDQFGQPVAGETVNFAVQTLEVVDGPGTVTFIDGPVAVTDADGEAVLTYTFDRAGSQDITATVAGTTITATAAKCWAPFLEGFDFFEFGLINVPAGLGAAYNNQPFQILAATTLDATPALIATGVYTNAAAQTINVQGLAGGILYLVFPNMSRTDGLANCFTNQPTENGLLVELAPFFEENPLGTEHTVTATVFDSFGNPLNSADFLFSYEVVGPNAQGPTAPVQGLNTFTYTGEVAGDDLIFVDVYTLDGTFVTGAVAFKTWIPDVAVPTVTLAPGTAINLVGDEHTVTATLSAGFDAADFWFSYIVEGPNAQGPTTPVQGGTTFTYAGAADGTDTIVVGVFATATAADPIATNTATKEWVDLAVAGRIVVDPPAAVNLLDEDHPFTVTIPAAIAAGLTVSFEVTADLDGEIVVAEGTPVAFGAGGVAAFNVEALAEGEYTITIFVYDAAGNVLGTATAAKAWVEFVAQAGVFGVVEHRAYLDENDVLVPAGPAEGVTVEVRNAVTAEVLGSAVTDEFGDYFIDLSAVTADTQVEVVAFGAGFGDTFIFDTYLAGTSVEVGFQDFRPEAEDRRLARATDPPTAPQVFTGFIPGFSAG
jgi:hypothetical protein